MINLMAKNYYTFTLLKLSKLRDNYILLTNVLKFAIYNVMRMKTDHKSTLQMKSSLHR